MISKNVINIISGASKLARHSKDTIEKCGGEYLERNLMKNNYVTREEYDKLSKLVIKLQKELDQLRKKH